MENLKWFKELIESFVSPRGLLALVLLVAGVVLFAPPMIIAGLKLEQLKANYESYFGIAWLVSLVILLIMLASFLLQKAKALLKARRGLAQAKRSGLTAEHTVILRFLDSRAPASERLLDDHPLVFRLWQTGLIEKLFMGILIVPDRYSSYKVTEIGMMYFRDRFYHDMQAPLDDLQIVNSVTEQNFERGGRIKL